MIRGKAYLWSVTGSFLGNPEEASTYKQASHFNRGATIYQEDLRRPEYSSKS